MNTSNKILAGFFLIVFLVPAIMVMAFKSKIRRNEYKLVSRESFDHGNWKTGKLQSPKVVKLVGTFGNALRVNLNFADEARYGYGVGEGDSVRIITTGDTVQIQYSYTGSQAENNWGPRVYFDLSLPGIEKLIVENAEVNILSLDSSNTHSLAVAIRGNGNVNIGATNDQFIPPGDRKPIRLASLSADIDGATMNMGSGVQIGSMVLKAAGTSRLFIDKDAVIGTMSGTVSDNTRVEAVWQYLKQLSAATAQ